MRYFANTHIKRFWQNHSCLFLRQWMIMKNWATDRWQTVFILFFFFFLFQPWPVQKGDESKWVCLQKAGAEEWACLPTMVRLLFSQFSVDRSKPGRWPGQICETHRSPEHIDCCHANERFGPTRVRTACNLPQGHTCITRRRSRCVSVSHRHIINNSLCRRRSKCCKSSAASEPEWNKPILLRDCLSTWFTLWHSWLFYNKSWHFNGTRCKVMKT